MSNNNKKVVNEFYRNSPIAKKMQSENEGEKYILDNIEKPNEEVKIKLSECCTYHENNIVQVLSLLNNISVKGSDNCKTLATVYDILSKTALERGKIDVNM